MLRERKQRKSTREEKMMENKIKVSILFLFDTTSSFYLFKLINIKIK